MDGNLALVTTDPIDPARMLGGALTPADGAALLFWGVVRQENDGRAVSQLEYSAYGPMAQREMLRIADEARERFGTGAIHVVHRVGRLEIGEASVAIAVASPHRAEAYEASRYVIEQLKQRVPVWKREGYVDGQTEWVPGFSPVAEAAR
ncbi:MAG TPA: molybdenum cofactor biosynthesis protein MoaE [Longimicrobium sp.]|uniref:molybdenum cofactor biosynthesis protein MoaE n=1 Tax=Longimicrobium sp. TaxID=2029185 RepID=UPI002ED8E746